MTNEEKASAELLLRQHVRAEEKANEILRLCYEYFSHPRGDCTDKVMAKVIQNVIEDKKDVFSVPRKLRADCFRKRKYHIFGKV